MATIQLNSGHQGLYKSPYSCVSTYHKRSILDQGMKDTIRSDEFPRYNTTFSRHHVGVERTIIDWDSYADDGFIDRDEPLSDMQQKYITPEGAAEKMEIGSKSGSSAALSQRIEGSTQVMPSVSEFVSAEVEPDYRNLDVDLAAISDSDPPHNTSSDTADGNGLASGTTVTSDRTITDHQNDNDSGIVDNARPQLAAGLVRLTSLSYGSVTHPASPMPVNPEITHGNASYSDLDVIQEAENEVVDAFADDEDDADTCSTKRSDSSIISSHKSASDRNVFELLASQHDSAQLPQPGPGAASLQQSDLTNDSLSRHRRQRDNTKIAHRKRLRNPVPTGSASTASHISWALESNEFDCTQSVTRPTAPAKERESDTNQEMPDDGGSDDSDDEDCDDINDYAASEIRRPPRSRKRVKRAKDTETNDVDTASTHSLNVSHQATAAISSARMQESEEIPIHGYLKLKTINSEVVYCLTFFQHPSPEPGISQRHSIWDEIKSAIR